jgi:hypothetical protein
MLRPTLVLVLLAVAALPATQVEASSDSGPSARETRGPIHIVRNEDFLVAANGIRSGSGTPDDPYLISDWVIDMAQPTGLFYSAGLNIANTDKHVLLRNIQFRGLNGDLGFNVQDAQNVRVHGMEIVDTRRTAVSLRSAQGVSIDALKVDAAEVGLLSQTSHGITITNSSITKSSISSFVVRGGGGFTLQNVTIEGSERAGGFHAESVRDVLLESVRARGHMTTAGKGINFLDCTNVTLRGVVSERNDATGLSVQRCKQVRVEDSSFMRNLGSRQVDGLQVRSSEGVVLLRVEAGRNQGNGMDISQSTAVEVRDALVEGNQERGLMVSQSSPLLIEGGNFSSNERTGVYVTSHDVVINGTHIYGNRDRSYGGIYASGRNMTITNNTVTMNNGYGIAFRAEGSRLQFNDARNNEKGGISADRESNIVGPNLGEVVYRDHFAPGAPLVALLAALAFLALALRRR